MIALLIAALLSAPAQLTDDEVRAKVEAYLGAIDRPVPVQRLKELGPRAADLLEPIAKDPAEFPTRRAMALDGLAVVAPDPAARVLGPPARDEKQPVVLRVAAGGPGAAGGAGNEGRGAERARRVGRRCRGGRDGGGG